MHKLRSLDAIHGNITLDHPRDIKKNTRGLTRRGYLAKVSSVKSLHTMVSNYTVPTVSLVDSKALENS